MLSEEEIINEVEKIKKHQIAVFEPKENTQVIRNYFTEKQRNAIQGLLDLYEKEKEEKEKFKKALGKRITYCNELEKDLFENCSKYVISKDKIKAKIEEIDIEIQCCEYADDDTEEYKQDIEKEKRRLLRDKAVLEELLKESEPS